MLSCTIMLTIMYAFWTNIYIVMYVAVSHVRSNVKRNPIKICPLAAILRFFYVFPAQQGTPAVLGKRKKDSKRVRFESD